MVDKVNPNPGILLYTRIKKSPYYYGSRRHGVQLYSVYNHYYHPRHYGDPFEEYWQLLEGVTLWERVSAAIFGGRGIFDRQEAGDRLLLQPFACVTLVDRTPRCELRGSRRPLIDQRSVEAQPVTDVNGKDVDRSETRLEQPLDEAFSFLGGGIGSFGGAHFQPPSFLIAASTRSGKSSQGT